MWHKAKDIEGIMDLAYTVQKSSHASKYKLFIIAQNELWLIGLVGSR